MGTINLQEKTKSIARINKAIGVTFPGIKLKSGGGYYYIYSDDDALGLEIAGLYTSSICGIFSLDAQTIGAWIKDVERLLNQGDDFHGEPNDAD